MKRIKHFKEKMSIESRDGIIALWIFKACYLAAVIYYYIIYLYKILKIKLKNILNSLIIICIL